MDDEFDEIENACPFCEAGLLAEEDGLYCLDGCGLIYAWDDDDDDLGD